MKNETYKDWRLFDDIPSGWSIDKTCGSPLTGYVFIHSGKSILRGGKRALLRVMKPQYQLCLDAPAISDMETTADESLEEKIAQPYPARTVN